MTGLQPYDQINYLVQWFREWSELQRSDFLPIMVENYANNPYVNGIVNSISNVNFRDKPMSLFECRIKLFKEWFLQWNSQQKDDFFKKITELDENFAEKLKSEMQNGVSEVNHENLNGEVVLED